MGIYPSALPAAGRRIVPLLFCAGLVLLAPRPVCAHKPLVLFDQGHGQRFTVEDENPLGLSRLAEVLRDEGAQVGTLQGRIDGTALAGAKALVVSGPFAPFQASEVEAITDFIMRGGRVSIMLHIAPPVTSLLDGLGVRAERDEACCHAIRLPLVGGMEKRSPRVAQKEKRGKVLQICGK